MSITMLKTIEVILLVGFGILMYYYVIDLMDLPKIIIPYAKASSIVGTVIMIGCSIA